MKTVLTLLLLMVTISLSALPTSAEKLTIHGSSTMAEINEVATMKEAIGKEYEVVGGTVQNLISAFRLVKRVA